MWPITSRQIDNCTRVLHIRLHRAENWDSCSRKMKKGSPQQCASLAEFAFAVCLNMSIGMSSFQAGWVGGGGGKLLRLLSYKEKRLETQELTATIFV